MSCPTSSGIVVCCIKFCQLVELKFCCNFQGLIWQLVTADQLASIPWGNQFLQSSFLKHSRDQRMLRSRPEQNIYYTGKHPYKYVCIHNSSTLCRGDGSFSVVNIFVNIFVKTNHIGGNQRANTNLLGYSWHTIAGMCAGQLLQTFVKFLLNDTNNITFQKLWLNVQILTYNNIHQNNMVHDYAGVQITFVTERTENFGVPCPLLVPHPLFHTISILP